MVHFGLTNKFNDIKWKQRKLLILKGKNLSEIEGKWSSLNGLVLRLQNVYCLQYKTKETCIMNFRLFIQHTQIERLAIQVI